MRKKDVPCAGGCGGFVWRGQGCLPPGQATCHPCRRRIREAREAARPLRGPRTAPVCEVCRAEYRKTYPEQRTCGRTCGLALRRRTIVVRPCVRCGDAVTTNATTTKVLCGPGCTQPPKAKPKPPKRSKTCGHCSTTYTDGGHRYCSPDCAQLARRRADLVRYGKTPEQIDSRVCADCNAPLGEQPHGSRKYCDRCAPSRERESRRCGRRRRRARERGAESEPYTLAEIAERDRYRCGICLQRVPMTKPVPHPKAPTIDHLIPISEGGHDVKVNVQLAHFLCNSTRGAGGVVQLLLIG